jgi:hypothetical protein
MSSEHGFATRDNAERLHREGVQLAERVDTTVCGILTDLARMKGLMLKEPVRGMVYRDRPSANHCYAMWQLVRDRGQFLAKVELYSDDAFDHLYFKASMQSRFWESEAQRFGENLCQVTAVQVAVERTQTDGIVTFSATMSPSSTAP